MKIGPLQAEPPILSSPPAVPVTPRLGINWGKWDTSNKRNFLINMDMIFDHDTVEKVHHET